MLLRQLTFHNWGVPDLPRLYLENFRSALSYPEAHPEQLGEHFRGPFVKAREE